MVQACLALKVDLSEIIVGNKEKLSRRFPGEEFTVKNNENRAKGDV